jgi:4-hydroxy-tetrahydrodipicolinate reductase
MNIALIGYGKMGKTIEGMGKKQGHNFPLIIDLENPGDLNREKLKGIHVAIEFTVPDSAPENVRACIELGVPVVSGTTGWNDRIGAMEALCHRKDGAFFHASNFSIGVNILFAMNRKLAGIMDRFPEYTPSIEEIHHIHKLDAPSGTALTLARDMIGEMDRIRDWSLERDRDASTLQIRAIREGEVKGKHRVSYESDLDILFLGHEAKSRDAFAAGALLAAGFLKDKKGVYTMEDLLRI